jgi:hypothetical protein
MLVFCLGHRHIICDLFADVSIQYIRKLWKATKKRVSGFLSCLCCRPSRPATAAVWCWCCSVPILMMRKWWLPFFPPFHFPGMFVVGCDPQQTIKKTGSRESIFFLHPFSVLSCYYLGSHLTFVASAAGWRSSRLSNSPDHPTFCCRDDENPLPSAPGNSFECNGLLLLMRPVNNKELYPPPPTLGAHYQPLGMPTRTGRRGWWWTSALLIS